MGEGKKVVKNSIIYVLLGFLAPAVNFFLIPIYTKELSPADFGIITLAALVVSVLINIIGLGVQGSFTRYYYHYLEDKKKIAELLSSSILVVLGSAAAIGIFAFFTGEQLFRLSFKNELFTYSIYGLSIVITAAAMNIQTLTSAYFRNEENVKAYCFWSVFFFLSVVVGIFLGVVVLKRGAIGSVNGRMWGCLVPSLAFIVYFYFKHPLVWTTPLVRELLKYGWPLVLYTSITLAFNSIDKVVIERFFSLDALGIYGFAYLVATVVEVLITALNNSVNPQVYRLLKQNDEDAFVQIKRTLNNSFLALLLLMSLMIAFANPLITIFINSNYHKVIFYLPLLILSYIPRLFFIYYSIPLYYYHKTKVLPLQSAISLILGIGYNLLLIPYLGIYGVCIALFLTRLTQCLLAYIICKKLRLFPSQAFDLTHSHKASFLVLLVACVAIVAQPNLNAFWQVWLYTGIFITILPFLFYKYYTQFKELTGRLTFLNR